MNCRDEKEGKRASDRDKVKRRCEEERGRERRSLPRIALKDRIDAFDEKAKRKVSES